MSYPRFAIKVIKRTSPSTERTVTVFDFEIEWDKKTHKPKKFKFLPSTKAIKQAIKDDIEGR